MAMNFEKGALLAIFAGMLLLPAGCSKSKDEPAPFDGQDSTPLSFPLSASVLKNCRFQTPNPTYFSGQAIPPNPILCEEGAVKTVSVLNASPLPSGLSFSSSLMSLVGTPTEKIPATSFQFYLENEAGYVILKMQLTVR